MKKHRFFYVMLLVFILSSIGNIYSQPGCITLSFAGDNNGTPVNLDSVWIKNITQNCDTTIYPPDLSLVIDTLMTGSVDHQITGNGFTLRNNPNPFRDRTTIMINLPAGDYVKMITVSQTGQVEAEYSGWLDEGFSTFEFAPGRGSVHLLTVFWRDQRLSVKLISNGSQKISCSRLTLLNQSTPDYKSISEVKSFFDYDPGDQLLMVGYGDDLESGLLDSPAMSNDYVFQFATNIPCPGLDSLEYEGKYYHTIQIMSQCWLKENLDAGTM
ncbi:MAG: hypothetical protein FJY07_12145, partial [Bacteroidetes bacterium]|nr:hypothetical protein [Bacteroidota bacterium]